MHVRTPNRGILGVSLLLASLGGTSAALAQAVDPELMIVLDASARLQWRIDGTEPVGCENSTNRPFTVAAPNNLDRAAASANRTRMNILKQALAGTTSVPDMCLVEDDLWRYNEHAYGADRITRHHRDLCCQNPNSVTGVCPAGAQFRPCYNDHGLAPGADADAQVVPDFPNAYFSGAGGFIDANRQRLRFGLMVSDPSPFGDPTQPVPGPLGDARDPTSFGADNYVVGIAGNNVDPQRRYGIAASPGGRPTFIRFDNSGVVRHPNLGIRSSTAKNGFLVPTYVGGYQMFPAPFGAPNVVPNAPIISDPGEHNDLVRYAIKRTVAQGNSPLSAMLHDMRSHYGSVDENDDPDTSCRPKAAVIFTDGTETPYYGGEFCALPLNEDVEVDAPGCDGGKGTCTWRPLLDANGAQRACGAGCIAAAGEVCRPIDGVDVANGTTCMRPACQYPDGYPYPTARSAAAELFAKGIDVYVVALWPDAHGRNYAKNLAAAGAPGRGLNGGDGYFEIDANDPEAAMVQIKAALDLVAFRLGATRTTNGKPLVINPSAADEDGQLRTVRQWRMFGYTESPRGDSRDYGRIDALAYGCPANAQSSVEVLPNSSAFFHETLRDRPLADPRRSVAVKPPENPRLAAGPDTGGVTGVVGLAGALFGDTPARFEPDVVAALWPSVQPLAGNLAADSVEASAMTRMFQGFLGNVGLPGFGPRQPQVGTRSFGGVGQGEMAALGPPGLGLPDDGYTNFVAAKKNRPTLVASGANDGQVHVFRAADGYEVFTFVPRRAWRTAQHGNGAAEGPLEFGDMIGCRSLAAGGPAECAASPTLAGYRTLLVGGIGRPTNGSRGDNLFGIDLTRVRVESESAVPVAVDLTDFETLGRGRLWDVTGDEVPKLGDTVSRPTLTHARIKNVVGLDPADAVRAIVIVGCGDEPSGYVPPVNGNLNPSQLVGRCILIINATDGRVIRQIDDVNMDAPMVGSPAVYPGVGVTPAERAYIGDAQGRIWRLDMRDPSPEQWTVAIAWPPVGMVDPPLGHPSLDRPALVTREDGGLVVLYGQGRGGADANPRNVVSFTDRLVPAAQANQPPVFQASLNWTMPLRSSEVVTGAPVVYDRTAFFTTVSRPTAVGACTPVLSRLYGVHYYDVLRDEDGDVVTYNRPDDDPNEAAATISVRPMLPRVAEDGTADEPALSLALPPGRQVSGLALASTPSCVDGDAPTTDIILNVADQSAGAAPGGAARQKIEFVENGALTAAPFDNSIYVDGDGVGMRVCLNCDRDGTSRGQGGVRITPFPSEVVYWGTTFTN